MLLDLIDRHMNEIAKLEDAVERGVFRSHDEAARYRSDYCERMAQMIVGFPRKWQVSLPFFLGVSAGEARAMTRRSEAAGNPPAQFEMLLSFQIAGALLRGHLLATDE